MKVKLIKKYAGAIFMIIYLVISMSYTPILAQSSSVKVDVKTISNANLNISIDEEESKNQQIYSINLKNDTKTTQNLSRVNVTVTPKKLIPNGTTYVVGSDEMNRKEGYAIQTLTGQAIKNNDNNMYLMFKNSETDYVLVGVLSWRTFLCQIFTEDGVVHINGDGDGKQLNSEEEVKFEKVVYMRDASWQNLLDRYAILIAKENNVTKPPKVSWTGWATWDFYVQYFLPEDIDRNTNLIADLGVNPNIIQIDGGWWKQRGDYFDVRDNIPGGIKAMVEKIHQKGYKAGLHFDGFRASAGAKIVKEHPEYFVHDESGQILKIGKDPVTKDALVSWDYSHPGAQKFIYDVMKNARDNWKVDYFKIDFMRDGLLAKGKSYLPVTHVERYRMGVDAMRKGMGNAYFLACSPNFGVNIGFTEATRTGPDIDPDYEAVKTRAQSNSANYYFAQKIYNVDPDYLVLRDKTQSNERDGKKPSLTVQEGQMWANFVSIYGNARLQSDELSLLPTEKMEIIKNNFNLPFFEKTIPMDWWDHYKTNSDVPNFFLAKGENGDICLAIFNWADKDANFKISGFKKAAAFKSYLGNTAFKTEDGNLTIKLKGVESILLKYEGKQTFDELRKALQLIK